MNALADDATGELQRRQLRAGLRVARWPAHLRSRGRAGSARRAGSVGPRRRVVARDPTRVAHCPCLPLAHCPIAHCPCPIAIAIVSPTARSGAAAARLHAGSERGRGGRRRRRGPRAGHVGAAAPEQPAGAASPLQPGARALQSLPGAPAPRAAPPPCAARHPRPPLRARLASPSPVCCAGSRVPPRATSLPLASNRPPPLRAALSCSLSAAATRLHGALGRGALGPGARARAGHRAVRGAGGLGVRHARSRGEPRTTHYACIVPSMGCMVAP
jgi:hypothetical protein